MTKPREPTSAPGPALSARIQADIATLDLELAEIGLLVGQARTEAARHEQKRAQAAERIAGPAKPVDPGEVTDAYASLVALTGRAVVMEAQVDLLDSKRRALARHRAAAADLLAAIELLPIRSAAEITADGGGGLPPSLSRVVLSAQEDLRREIARAMHDGPAQSLTNIVLQAQIVERLLERDPSNARGELQELVVMVQQTLDATKNFIFDVRPMVLDDLGLVPTLRRDARDRGQRAHIPVEFESLGRDRRLPMEVESAVFRILDEALAAYLSLAPERIVLRLDWTDDLEARLSAHRAPTAPGGDALPAVPTDDVPDAIRRMIQDRHDARAAAETAAEVAAIVVLPTPARRDIEARAGAIGARLEVLADGGEIHLVVPLPPVAEPGAEA
ncbi:MAG: sensor histidine kinase [Candidatus Limnocylindrales bacterium]